MSTKLTGTAMFHNIARDFRAYGVNSSSSWAKYLIALTTLGFYVMLLHRISSAMVQLGPIGIIVSRLIDLTSSIISGCHISPRASIGGGLYLPHAVGIVIGQRVAIAENVTIYQHVTLGSSSVGADAYPRIGPHVTIFANAVIVGNICIGSHAIIGASAVVLGDVPAQGRAVGNPARIRASSNYTTDI